MTKIAPGGKAEQYTMKWSSIVVPPALNPKATGSNYLKGEPNTIWGRKGKAKEEVQETVVKKGSNIIVIHPGSKSLRMGRASDLTPISITNVIARKHSAPVPPPVVYPRVYSSPPEVVNKGPATIPADNDEYGVKIATEDPMDRRIASIVVSLRDRMRFYKLAVAKDAAATAAKFNSQVKPELIPEENDPYRIQWVTTPPTNETVVGERVFRLVEPHDMGFAVRWPIIGNRLNTRQYKSNAELMGDVEAMWVTVLRDGMRIERKNYKDYSVILVVPDFYDRTYLREMCHLILVTMGFKQLCVQQESLTATFGAGLSNACVIDIGAVKTSIACVDDGMVIPESRIILSMGGDDVTEFFQNLLSRIDFPYRDLSLSRPTDWQILEDLKTRLCTLSESEVAENVYDFVVRSPGNPSAKYPFKAYDEVILAPMCIFEPKVIDFDTKQTGLRPTKEPDIEEVIQHLSDYATQAMIISTQHLLPTLISTSENGAGPAPDAAAGEQAPQVNGIEGEPPTGQGETKGEGDDAAVPSTETSAPPEAAEDVEMNGDEPPVPPPPAPEAPPAPVDTEMEGKPPESVPESSAPDATTIPTTETETQVQTQTQTQTEAPPTEMDLDLGPVAARPVIDPTCSFPGGFPIDVEFEASKLPLDVAVFNSARAAGGDEKIRKYLQAVLVIGGTSMIPGMGHALESRLQAIATPLVSNMEKVQIIPPPKDVDPRHLAWKGGCVLAKMDSVNEMWVTPADWDKFELRAIRERCFFF